MPVSVKLVGEPESIILGEVKYDEFLDAWASARENRDFIYYEEEGREAAFHPDNILWVAPIEEE